MYSSYMDSWRNDVNRDIAARGRGRNKLRTYKLIKSEHQVESYLSARIPQSHRSALAKFRCGVAPLRLETGRYENLDLDRRVCFQCTDQIESEEHVLITCPLYEDIRYYLFKDAEYVDNDFIHMSDLEKLCMVLRHDQLVKVSAKTCCDILERRRRFLFR
jgi:hypothetical protein